MSPAFAFGYKSYTNSFLRNFQQIVHIFFQNFFPFFLSRRFPCFIHQKKSFCSPSDIIWAAYVTGACITAHRISVAASFPFFHHSPQRMPFMRAPVKWKKLGTFLATEFRFIPLIGIFGYFGYQLDQNHDAKKSQYKGKSKMFGPWSDPNNPPY